MGSNFFLLQITTGILREGGNAVQCVYDKKFSNQDQLSKGEAVVTLSGNLLNNILIHVTGNMLLQHIFDAYFRLILSLRTLRILNFEDIKLKLKDFC